MNLRFDGVVHGSYHSTVVPWCGSSTIPALEIEWTDDEIDCADCLAIEGDMK